MARIAGVTTQKDTKGNITHVTINVKKHREVITPLLEKLGVLAKSQSQHTVDREEWLTPDELEKSLLKTVEDFYAGNNKSPVKAKVR